MVLLPPPLLLLPLLLLLLLLLLLPLLLLLLPRWWSGSGVAVNAAGQPIRLSPAGGVVGCADRICQRTTPYALKAALGHSGERGACSPCARYSNAAARGGAAAAWR